MDQTSVPVPDPSPLDMDMYEINSRRRNRRVKPAQAEGYQFKSIPNLSVGDYDSREFYSLAPGVYNTLETVDRSTVYRSLDNEKMYRSLGYIPSSDTARARQYEEEVQPTKK